MTTPAQIAEEKTRTMILNVRDGQFFIRRGPRERAFPPTEAGAIAAATWHRANRVTILYSSSVDHPVEYGLSVDDVDAWIEIFEGPIVSSQRGAKTIIVETLGSSYRTATILCPVTAEERRQAADVAMDMMSSDMELVFAKDDGGLYLRGGRAEWRNRLALILEGVIRGSRASF